MSYKDKLIKISIAILSLIFIFVLIEFILLNFVDTSDDLKIRFIKDEYFGNCYSSDKSNYFPIILKDSSENQELFKEWFQLSDDSIKEFIDKTPYCIVHNSHKRNLGFFPERKKEVIIVGDSFAFGEGVKDKDTWAYLLSTKFNEYNFKNFGKPSTDVIDIYNEISNIKKSDNTKGIIYFYNLNDVLTSDKINNKMKYITDFQNIRWHNIQDNYPKFITSFMSKSKILALLIKTLILQRETRLTVDNYLEMYFSPSNEKEFNKTINTMISANDVLKEKGIDFQVVIYPLLYKDIFGRYPFEPIHKLLIEKCREYNISCIDLYPAFEEYYSLKKFTVHPVDYHPNGLANKLAVDYLAENDEFIVNQKSKEK